MTATTILVVEDERIIAKGIEKRLKSLGYAVAGSAATGEEAVRLAVDLRPDLVLMDIHLGDGIDGVEAATRIRREVDLPIVFLTAHSDDATLQRAKLTGPLGYVLKPYEDKDLRTAIEVGVYRHQMERRLRENEQWLAAVLSSIGDGVIATDDGGRVRFANTVAENLTGWSQSDIVGKHVLEVFNVARGESERASVSNPVAEVLTTGQPAGPALGSSLKSRDGSVRPVDGNAAPIRESGGRMCGTILVFRDLTERLRLEGYVRQARTMEAVGRLADGVAQDFNNLMSVVSGYSDILISDTVAASKLSTADRLAAFRHINTASRRATALTQQIMAFSRKQRLAPAVLDLNTIVHNTESAIRISLQGTNVEFTVDLANDLDRVKADPTQVGQVILHLAVNSRDAMPTGGQLAIGTRNVEVGAGDVRHRPDWQPGKYVMLTVADTGTGMSEELLTHVFEPFFSTKSLGRGSGLGLATVYGAVKQSGGHVEVSSSLGKGTTVRVYWPSTDERAAENAISRPTAGGNETILVVEDDEAVREMIEVALLQKGYRVVSAANQEEAVAVAERCDGPIQLLLTNLVLQQGSGEEVAKQLRRSNPELKVLFTAGYAEESTCHKPEIATAEILQKPLSLERLKEKIRLILDKNNRS